MPGTGSVSVAHASATARSNSELIRRAERIVQVPRGSVACDANSRKLVKLAVAVAAFGVIGYAARDVLAAWLAPLGDRVAAALEATAQRVLTVLLALSRLLLQWLLNLAGLAARFVGRNAAVRAAAAWVGALGASAWQRLVVLMEWLKGLLVMLLNSMG